MKLAPRDRDRVEVDIRGLRVQMLSNVLDSAREVNREQGAGLQSYLPPWGNRGLESQMGLHSSPPPSECNHPVSALFLCLVTGTGGLGQP